MNWRGQLCVTNAYLLDWPEDLWALAAPEEADPRTVVVLKVEVPTSPAVQIFNGATVCMVYGQAQPVINANI